MPDRTDAGIPDAPICADCGIDLVEPFGWCSNCQAAYCFACGNGHYCKPTCATAGCLVGLCVRIVDGGRLGSWRQPSGLDQPT